ncbi:Uncharacterised protein [Pragia fontium]|nr:Uncharacterised protein [Pragia fontium]VEJ54390.1 Uncharacterised protein [Pragia fontium]
MLNDTDGGTTADILTYTFLCVSVIFTKITRD